jgi:hypothetical protein
VVAAVTKVIASPTAPLNTTVPALCCAKVQPCGYITDHDELPGDAKVWKDKVEVYWRSAVIQPAWLEPFTSHHPPPDEVWETIGRDTPCATTPTTDADAAGAVRKFTPRGAITVTDVGAGVALADGCGAGRETAGVGL